MPAALAWHSAGNDGAAKEDNDTSTFWSEVGEFLTWQVEDPAWGPKHGEGLWKELSHHNLLVYEVTHLVIRYIK
jgi:hypothetical protein